MVTYEELDKVSYFLSVAVLFVPVGIFACYTPWQNIARITHDGRRWLLIELRVLAEMRRSVRDGQEQGIAVIQRRRMSWWLGTDSFLLKPNTAGILVSTTLVSFREWEQGAFCQYSKQYVPHLLKEDNED